jgi:Hemerythrin HHE cation binding domain
MAKATNSDAIALLKADHRKVEELFDKFKAAKGADQKRQLVEQICTELTLHTIIEEEIFYPACKGEIEGDMVDQAFVEHDGAKVLIAELETSSPGDGFYDAKVTVLSEQIKHHVQEEERRSEGLFAKARAAGLDMDELGARMLARKQQLLAQIRVDGLPPPELRTLAGRAAAR